MGDSIGPKSRNPPVSRRALAGALTALGATCVSRKASAGVFVPQATAVSQNPYVVDLVRDCGADPTGATDCGPALTKAGQLLSALGTDPRTAATSVVLDCPPGIYLVQTPPALWNFDGGTTSVRVHGYLDATIFLLDQVPGRIFDIANAYDIIVEALTFVGATNDNVTADAQVILATNSFRTSRIQDCRFVYMLVSMMGVYVQGSVVIDNCQFTFSGCQDADQGLIYAYQPASLVVQNTTFTDPDFLNGDAFKVVKVGGGYTYIRVYGTQALNSGGRCHAIVIRNCTFDEGTNNQVWISGISGQPFGFVRIEDCHSNVPIHVGVSTAGYLFENVQRVEISNLIGNFVTGNVTCPMVALSAVNTAVLTSISINPAANGNYITADAACGFVSIVDSPALPTQNIQSLAAQTTVEAEGVKADVRLAANAITQFQLVKMAPVSGGVTPLGTADTWRDVFGVCLDAATVGSQQVRVARKNQPVTVLSDGTSAIMPGDLVSVSGTSGGRVCVATPEAATVGWALSSAAATADTPVQVLLQPRPGEQPASVVTPPWGRLL